MKTYLSVLCAVFISSVTWANSFEKVLFVGDSHSYGNFGTEVDKYLRSISDKVTTYASCGSSPSTWLKKDGKYKTTNCGHLIKDSNGRELRAKSHATEYFPGEVQKIHPDLTVIAMGTNILASPGNIKSEIASMKKMLDEVNNANSKCIWIGPPSITKRPFADNLASGIKEMKAVAEKNNCVFIDSKPLTAYPAKGDGIHYSGQAASKWGQDVAKQIEQKRKTLESKSGDYKPKASSVKSSGVR